MLASGVNVVTTRGEFHRPASMEASVRERVEGACAEGGSSIHSTGSSPGFITEALPIVLTSIQRRLERLTIWEFADLSQRDSPGLLFEVMGFGQHPWEFDEGRLSHGRTSFGPSLHLLADAVVDPVGLDRGARRGRHRRPFGRDRGRHHRGGHGGGAADGGLRHDATDGRSCSSVRRGTAPPISIGSGTCAPQGGGSRSTVTRRST